jgi:peptide-methionine (S)-S-oxide reductase
MAKATFGAGCFWHVESAFRAIPGVTATTVGFEGGATKNPSYKEVCRHDTGHAEVVQVEFDPTVVGYEELLRKFFHAHDPTTLNRQGGDVGSSYRSIILFKDDNQKAIAEKVKAARARSRSRSKTARPR